MSETPPETGSGFGSQGAFVGVIPGAGASRRMGRAKALLRIGGESFLGRAIRSLSEGGCDPVIVVVAAGDTEIAAEAAAHGAVLLENPDPGEGPITSLRIALAALARGVAGVAYLPVDHPMVMPETVGRLIEAAREGGDPLTVPLHEGERGHPALLGSGLFAELADPELRGGARTVVHRHLPGARLVVVDDPGVLVDVDTPEAYASLLRDSLQGTGGTA